jgi:hypothetical protein
MTKIKRTNTTKKGTFMSKITFTWTPTNSITRMKLEHYLNELINDGYVTVTGMRKTRLGNVLSNGSNKISIYGKSSRIDNIISELKQFIPDLQDECKKRTNEGLTIDGSYNYDVEQIVDNISEDFLDDIYNEFGEYVKKYDPEWFKNYKYGLTKNAVSEFFKTVLIDMLTDHSKFEEYILTPAINNIVAEMEADKEEFDDYIDLE